MSATIRLCAWVARADLESLEGVDRDAVVQLATDAKREHDALRDRVRELEGLLAKSDAELNRLQKAGRIVSTAQRAVLEAMAGASKSWLEYAVAQLTLADGDEEYPLWLLRACSAELDRREKEGA